ncbi:MAG TPA: zf-HC2 domain-containing protein [Candidatus Acidoferrales bacterium]
MTHYDDLTYSVYLDAELEPGVAREVRAHLAVCPACREKLRELEKVHLRLAAALGEVALPASLLAAPERTEPVPGLRWVSVLATGLASAGLYLVVSFVSRLFSLEPLEWLNLASMDGFFQFFFEPLRRFIEEDWMKRWIDWAGMGALGLLLASLFYYLRRIRLPARMALVSLALLIMLGAASPAGAVELRRRHGSYTLPANEVVHGDLLIGARDIRIDGTIEGDLISFSRSVTVNGTVKGDLIAFAREIRVNGTVSDDLRGFAQNITIEGNVGKHVTAFCQKLEISDKSQVGSNVYGFAAEVRVNGHLLRDLVLYAEETVLAGQVDGSVRIQGHRLNVASSARIPGKLFYRGYGKPVVDSGAQVGAMDFVQRVRKPRYTQPRFYLKQAIRYVGALLLAALLIWLVPRPLQRVVANVGSLGRGAGLGLLLAVSIPVAAVILMITMVGLPIGLIMGGLYAVLLYAGHIFAGTWLGAKVLSRPEGNLASVGAAAVGLLIYRLSKFIPYVGPLVTLVAAVVGLGAICFEIYSHLRPRAALPSAPAATASM